MRNALLIPCRLAVLLLATVGAACADRHQVVEVPYGNLTVTVTGLDGGPTPDVLIIGPTGQTQTLTGSKTFENVTPGRYQVIASPVASNTTRWVPQPATQLVDVLDNQTGTASIAYAIVTARIALAVTGLPANVPASITVTGPNGFIRTAPTSAALDLLDPGTYTIAATEVRSGETVYRPTLATQTVVLTPSAAATAVTVSYAVGSGSLALTVAGLPAGTTAAVTVRGPGNFARDVTGSATLGGLDPGTYVITAAPRTTADGQAVYSVPGSQSVTIPAGGGASATVTYALFELAYQTVASGLASPVYLTAPGGDARLFVVEQPGRIRVVRDGQLRVTPFLDISSRVAYGGERGLLSMAFDPAYATNGFFYVYFTNTSGDITVERYGSVPGSDVAVATPTPVITVPHPGAANHNGGLVTFGPDGMLYLGTGDGGGAGDPPGNAQNTNVLLGKLLRLDVHTLPYTIPSTNPFAGQSGKRGEIWAYGLRNPWRYDWDAAGRLFIADVGQDRYEEVDVVQATAAGVNYGWNTMEGTHCFAPASGCSSAGLQLPVAEYDHSKGCSITGGFAYRGAALPEVAGHFFFSDYCTGFLASVGPAGSGTATRPWSTPNAGNVLSFGEDGAGELYVLSADGTVRKLVRR